jgi:DNA modification methylase
MNIDEIYCMDCLEGLSKIESRSVQLVIADPPYELQQHNGAGAFGRANREYHQGIDHLQSGISDLVLYEMLRVCQHPNMYVFCSKDQLPQLLKFALDNKLSYDLLTWHKTNPVPTCNNKYLSDTEYIVFMRRGANLYGSYETKRKYFITQTNTADKKAWGHPTPKPVPIIQTLIENSTEPGALVLDPFMGSGTTAIAAIRSNRHYIGFELDEGYHKKCVERINCESQQQSLF